MVCLGHFSKRTRTALRTSDKPRVRRLPTPASTTCLLTLFPSDKARMAFNNAGPHLTPKRPVTQKHTCKMAQATGASPLSGNWPGASRHFPCSATAGVSKH